MNDFTEILDSFLLEIEKDPNRDVDEVIIEVASKFKNSEDDSFAYNLDEIRASLSYISELDSNINDLNNAKEDGVSRKNWFKKRINTKLDTIPLITEEKKSILLQSISNKVEKMVIAHKELLNLKD